MKFVDTIEQGVGAEPIAEPETPRKKFSAATIAQYAENVAPSESTSSAPPGYRVGIPPDNWPSGKPYYEKIPTGIPAQDPDTWADKVRAGIEAGGGALTSGVATVAGIPYGVFKGLYKAATGQPRGTLEEEAIGGIQDVTPSFLMPKTELGQQYMGNVGEALQGMPAIGAEGSVIGMGSNLAAQFAKAKAGASIAGLKSKQPLAIAPLAAQAEEHNVSPALRAEIVKHENAGTVNPVIAQRHMDADALPEVTDEFGNKNKIRLTKGMVTQDSKILSDEKNTRSVMDPVRQQMDENGRALPLILDHFQKEVAPDIKFGNNIEEGEFYINKLGEARDTLRDKTRADYKALHDAAEASGLTNTPLDQMAFAKDVEGRFKALGMYKDDLPAWTKRRVEEIASGDYPLTFKNFEQFRSDLGMEQRDLAKSTASGASRSLNAVNEIRDALENMPLTDEAKQLKPLADKARASAKLDFDLQKRSPAYKDVVNGTANPDDFVQKYLLGNRPKTASHQQVQNLIGMFPDDDEMRQALAFSTLKSIKDQVINSKGQLLSSKLNDAIANGESNGKHELLLHGTIKDGVNKEFTIRDGLDKLNKTAQLIQGVGEAGQYYQTNPNLAAKLANWTNSRAYTYLKKIPYVGEDIANIKSDFKSRQLASESTKPGAGLDYVRPTKQQPKEKTSIVQAFKNISRSPQVATQRPESFAAPTVAAGIAANRQNNEQ